VGFSEIRFSNSEIACGYMPASIKSLAFLTSPHAKAEVETDNINPDINNSMKILFFIVSPQMIMN